MDARSLITKRYKYIHEDQFRTPLDQFKQLNKNQLVITLISATPSVRFNIRMFMIVILLISQATKKIEYNNLNRKETK